MLGSLDSFVLLLVLVAGHLQAQFCSYFLHYAELERILAPPTVGFLQDTVLRHVEVVRQNALRICVQVVLSCDHADSLEDFDSEGAAGNRTNHIHCVTLSANVLAPCVQDVAALFNVNIGLDAINMDLKCLFEAVLRVIAALSCHVELLLELVLDLFLLLLFLFALALFRLSLILFQLEVELKIRFDNLVVGLRPSAEGLGSIALHPVNDSLLQESALLVPVIGRVDPGVEATRHLHVRAASDEVRHDLLAETLHLVDRVLLHILRDQNVILHLLYVALVLALPRLQLIDVLVVHVQSFVGHVLLPRCQRAELEVAVDAVVRARQEFLRELESADEHEPRVPAIALAHRLALLLKPPALLLDELSALSSRTLVPKLDEVVASAVSVHCLRREVDAALECIQSLGTANPPVVASTQHFAIEHVAQAFELSDLLSLSSLLLLSLDLALMVQIIDQILVLVNVVLSHFQQVHVDFLIRRLLPPHVRDAKSALVLVNQPQLKSLQHLLLKDNCILPDEQCFVHMVAVTQVALSQHVHLGLLGRVSDQAFLTVFKFHLLGDLVVQNVTRFFKF